MLIGTNLPLSDRQLRRMAKRSTVSLGRVGSYLGTGSGDIAIAFSNGNLIPHYSEQKILTAAYLHEDKMDNVFEATAETVEEAIISALYHADAMTGIRGRAAGVFIKNLELSSARQYPREKRQLRFHH